MRCAPRRPARERGSPPSCAASARYSTCKLRGGAISITSRAGEFPRHDFFSCQSVALSADFFVPFGGTTGKNGVSTVERFSEETVKHCRNGTTVAQEIFLQKFEVHGIFTDCSKNREFNMNFEKSLIHYYSPICAKSPNFFEKKSKKLLTFTPPCGILKLANLKS